jgi:hypothetical protein
VACLAKKAKIVYEFDAAESRPRNVPAMAGRFAAAARRSPPSSNTTRHHGRLQLRLVHHYLNLIYAPGKTLSFALAAEAFRRTPRLARFRRVSSLRRVRPFTLDFDRDMSVMRNDDAYLYATTPTAAAPPERLERVFGCGSSPVVRLRRHGRLLSSDRLGKWTMATGQVYPVPSGSTTRSRPTA